MSDAASPSPLLLPAPGSIPMGVVAHQDVAGHRAGRGVAIMGPSGCGKPRCSTCWGP
jgi:hypothetical protein